MANTLFTFLLSLLLYRTLATASHFETLLPFEDQLKCADGSRGIIEQLQPFVQDPFQPAMYTIQCPQVTLANSTDGLNPATSELVNGKKMLVKRQTNVCSSSCSTTCYGGTGSPTVADCQAVASYLSNRGQTNTVNSAQQIVASSGTCLYRFSNEGYGSLTWCDSAWATRGRAVAGSCLPQTPGGICQGSGFKLDVCLNPDAPAPVTTTPTSSPTPQAQTSSQNQGANRETSTSPTSTDTSTSTGTTSTTTGTTVTSNTSNSTIPGSRTGASQSVTSLVPLDPSDGTDTSNVADVGDSSESKRGKVPVPAIVGGILGALALLALLLFFCLWRRMQGNKNRDVLPSSSQGQDVTYMSEAAGSSHPADPYVAPPFQPTGPSKLALLRSGQQTLGDPAMTQGSSSSVLNLLISPTQMSSPYAHNTRSATQSYQDSDYSRDDDSSRQIPLQPQHHHPNDPTGLAGNYNNGNNNPRRSISARTLAQELAPHLSEQDIIRLADNIVARMQLNGAAIVNSEQNSRIVAGENESEFSVDPPPPWRASWTGRPTSNAASRTNS